MCVYFTAEFHDQTPRHNDGFENNEYLLLSYSEAIEMLTFQNMKDILSDANVKIGH